MSQRTKLFESMKNNPRDWRIEDLKKLADYFDIDYRQPGTSHVTFRTIDGQKLTVPAHKPIKPIYIKNFIILIEELKEIEND